MKNQKRVARRLCFAGVMLTISGAGLGLLGSTTYATSVGPGTVAPVGNAPYSTAGKPCDPSRNGYHFIMNQLTYPAGSTINAADFGPIMISFSDGSTAIASFTDLSGGKVAHFLNYTVNQTGSFTINSATMTFPAGTNITGYGEFRISHPPCGTTTTTVPVDTTPDETTPVDTTPVDTTPDDTTPVDTTPVDTTPDDTTPVDTTPVDTTPDDTTPVDTTPDDTTPVDTTPVETTPVDTTPVDTTPVETTPANTDETTTTAQLSSPVVVSDPTTTTQVASEAPVPPATLQAGANVVVSNPSLPVTGSAAETTAILGLFVLSAGLTLLGLSRRAQPVKG